jgi:hypothetical protein
MKMLVAPQSTIARTHCISPLLSGIVLHELCLPNPVFRCCIDTDLTFSSRVAISACAANSFCLLSVEKSLALDLSVAAFVINVIAVEDHSYGGWISIVHNTCALRGHHSHGSHGSRSAELCRSLTVNALHAEQCIADISSLQSMESFSSSMSFNRRVSSP